MKMLSRTFGFESAAEEDCEQRIRPVSRAASRRCDLMNDLMNDRMNDCMNDFMSQGIACVHIGCKPGPAAKGVR